MIRFGAVVLILLFGSAGAHGEIPRAFRTSTLKSHSGFNWVIERSAHYDFYFEASSPAARDIQHIKSEMESEYAHITALLGASNTSFHTDAFVVHSRLRMKQLCGHESNALAVGNVLLFVYGVDVKALGAHEEMHLLSQQLWGAPHGIWLAEGLAVYSDGTWRGYELYGVCKRLKLTGNILALASLQADRQFNRAPEMVTYPESGCLIKFLYERYGLDAVKSIWQMGAAGIPAATGKAVEEFEFEWLDVVDKSNEITEYDPQ